jgi:hypothetical protein
MRQSVRSLLLINQKNNRTARPMQICMSSRVHGLRGVSYSSQNLLRKPPSTPPPTSTQRCYPLVAGAQSASPWMSP